MGAGRKVTAYLRGIFPRASTPKEIAAELSISHDAVKKFLRRNPAFCTPIRRGLYRAFADAPLLRGVDLPEPQVHGICIVAPLSPSHPGPIRGAGLAEDQRVAYWRGRRVTIQFHPGGRVHGKIRKPHVAVYLKASDRPLNAPEFGTYVEHVRGILAALGVDADHPGVKVRELDMNADYPHPKVGLRGWSTMSLYGFQQGLLKVYHKRRLDVTRVEACLWPVDLTPEDAVRLLSEVTRPQAYVAPPEDPERREVA